jgi:signal transduction histidine kinase
MSLKLRTRATLLIASTFSALLATFLLLTFFVVKESFEQRTIEEMRSQLRAVLRALPVTATTADLQKQYQLHGRTGESPLALSVWHETTFLGVQGHDSLARYLPNTRVPISRNDTTYNAGQRFIVYALHDGEFWGAAVMSDHTTDEIIEEMISMFDVVLVIGILLSILVASLLSRFALDPISRLTSSTEALLERGSTSRLPIPKSPLEAQKLAKRFNQILEERDRSIDTLKSFTADVAHELRSPLTILRGELEVELRSGAANDSQRETLESSLEEVNHLSSIVDDLLYLARLENVNDSLLDVTDVDLLERVNKKLSRLAPLITNKKLAVETRVNAGLVLRANPAHIDRLLYNLLLNAAQYSHEGGTIEIYSVDNSLVIQDHGIGIEPGALNHVTERFYRADPSRNREQGNVGLGLAIANGITRRYGIDLKIESQSGQGTRITLVLP